MKWKYIGFIHKYVHRKLTQQKMYAIGKIESHGKLCVMQNIISQAFEGGDIIGKEALSM